METRLGLYDQAYERLLRALDLVENTDNTLVRLHSLTRILGTLAQNRLEAGDLAQAVAYVAKGWEAQKISSECIPCDVSLYPAAVPVYLALEDREAAAWAARKAEETAANFGSQAWSATAVYLRGLLARSTGDLVQAGQCLKQALDLFEELEQPYESALCMEALFDVGDAGAVESTPDSNPPQDQPAYLWSKLSPSTLALVQRGMKPEPASN